MMSHPIIHPRPSYHAANVLEALRQGKATIPQLATRLGYSQQTIKKSLNELRRWHLVFPTGGEYWQKN